MANEKLAYSELTKTVYLIDGKGNKTPFDNEFYQALLAWGCEGKLIEVGSESVKELKNGGVVHWEITIKRKSE